MRTIRHPHETADIPDEQALILEDAICAGHQMEWYGKERQPDGTHRQQAGLTHFTDPFTERGRFAVESWDGLDVRKWDFGSRGPAVKFYVEECKRLGV